MAKKRVLPRVHLLAICDDVQEQTAEVASFDLLGVRTHILAPEFPYRHEQACVYLQATAHPGNAVCRVAIVDAETEEALQTTPDVEVPFAGPLEFMHVYFQFTDCVFPEPGIYYVQVHFDDVLCGERALILIQQETGSNGRER